MGETSRSYEGKLLSRHSMLGIPALSWPGRCPVIHTPTWLTCCFHVVSATSEMMSWLGIWHSWFHSERGAQRKSQFLYILWAGTSELPLENNLPLVKDRRNGSVFKMSVWISVFRRQKMIWKSDIWFSRYWEKNSLILFGTPCKIFNFWNFRHFDWFGMDLKKHNVG